MVKKERLVTKRINIFDGQRVTETDLDTDQIHHRSTISNLVLDFHGSGIVKDFPFKDEILLDTRSPGKYSEEGEDNSSKLDIESGTYDGLGIFLDRQPSDTVRGNRIEFELVNANVKGRDKPKILVLGRSFDGINSQGQLVAEFIEFEKNTKKVSYHYYLKIIAVLFNNFSGGTGKTENQASVESLDLISEDDGYLIIREAPSLAVYPATRSVFQIESPNIDLVNFITSSPTRSIEDEIDLALGSTNSISDLFIDLNGREKIKFEKDGPTSIVYGQKFLAQANNIQRVDLLLSVERDEDQESENEFDFSGDIVVAIHELISEVNCTSDAVPDDLIDFDPEITPIVEMSFSQEDLETLGYKLNEDPQVVSFNFAGTLIADPNIDPSIEVNKYYAILISRRGDNRTGTIVLEKGYDKAFKKSDDGITLSILEQYQKQTSKYFEFDPTTKRYISDSESSLWFVVHSDTIEVTNGTVYSDSGIPTTILKTEEFVGGAEISHFERNIPLRTVSEGAANYVIVSHTDKFIDSETHPSTGNHAFTRILDSAKVTIVNSTELTDIQEDTTPIILAKIRDQNVRDAQIITGEIDKPGLIGISTVIILNPTNELLSSNLVNRVISPDTNCDCNAKYRIARVDCQKIKAGDLNADGDLTSADISLLLDLVGHTINSEVTERAILGGEIDVLDFVKADLNDDGTIDGTDISLLEDAVDGYVNFTVDEEIKILILRLENVLTDSDYPGIFADTEESGRTNADTNEIEFTTENDNQALIIRPGDTVEIPSSSDDAGKYIIVTKEVASNGVDVTVTVTDEDGGTVSFEGTSDFNVTVISGTRVNILADNQRLADIPFRTSTFSIDFIEAPFQEGFLDVCDLSRLVGVTFTEEKTSNSCECEETACLSEEECTPVYQNQTFLPGDLYLSNGQLLTAPGVPHRGDFEYVNIKIPIPAGTISDCSLDLYNTFIKAKSGSCLTAGGYPAMKYSDGTLVGCEDSGTSTDLTKNRVKIANAICSIHVDTLADGYTDGYSEDEDTATSTSAVVEAISENFKDISYTTFSDWTEDTLNSTSITNIDHPSGSNQAAIFDLTTSGDSILRFGRLNAPSEAQDFEGDFIVDFSAARTTWPGDSLTEGKVSSFMTLTVTNDDNSTAELSLGWKVVGGYATKIFYGGTLRDEAEVITSTFEYEIDAPDSVGEYVAFRLRRVNDVVSAYYIVPSRVDDSTVNSFGEYVKIGENPDEQPGSGSVEMSFEIAQQSSPTTNKSFFVRLSEVVIRSEYTSDDDVTTLTVGRSSSTKIIDRATLTFAFDLPRKTTIVSATLKLPMVNAGTVSDTYNIIPIDLINADNLGAIFNVPINTGASAMDSFTPGTFSANEELEVDVTIPFLFLQSEAGHLPGFIKGLVIEPAADANSSFVIKNTATLEVVYEDSSTGIIFKIGVSLDPKTGIMTLNTKNILYDSMIEENRTVLNFGVFLKKSGFRNDDINLSVNDLSRLGIGTCTDEDQLTEEDEQCYFIVGEAGVSSRIGGPFECSFLLP